MFFVLSQENKADINQIISQYDCICLYHWEFCGYCKMLMPTWNRLCNKYVRNKDIIIINIEKSDMPLLKTAYSKNIQGFPTIIKYAKGKRNEEYANKREFKELDEFIKGSKKK